MNGSSPLPSTRPAADERFRAGPFTTQPRWRAACHRDDVHELHGGHSHAREEDTPEPHLEEAIEAFGKLAGRVIAGEIV